MSNVALEDDFEVAARMGRVHGGCPIYELDDFYANHWDTETLCMQFRCAECVGDPMDALFDHDGWDPWSQEVPDEIPFWQSWPGGRWLDCRQAESPLAFTLSKCRQST